MKKVLIPFDFTNASKNAMEYAFDMFGSEAKYTVLHVLGGNLNTADPYVVIQGLTMSEGIEESITGIVEEIFSAKGLISKPQFSVEVKYGTVVHSIVEHAENQNSDVIVMGKRDKYKLLDKIFGTVCFGVVKSVVAPIFIIPSDASFHPFEKVVVAADDHLESDRVLDALASWNQNYNADMHFLHIKEQEFFDDEFIRNIVEEFFDKREVEFPFTIIEEEDKKITHKLIEYGNAQNADLHILISDIATWLESLSSKSISREMIIKSNKPMLVIHSGFRKFSNIFFNLLTV